MSGREGHHKLSKSLLSHKPGIEQAPPPHPGTEAEYLLQTTLSHSLSISQQSSQTSRGVSSTVLRLTWESVPGKSMQIPESESGQGGGNQWKQMLTQQEGRARKSETVAVGCLSQPASYCCEKTP